MRETSPIHSVCPCNINTSFRRTVVFNFKKLVSRLFPSQLPLQCLSHRFSLELLETREVPAATDLWIGGQGGGAAKTDWGNVADWHNSIRPDNRLVTLLHRPA